MKDLNDQLNTIIQNNPVMYEDRINDTFDILKKAFKKYQLKYRGIAYKIKLSNGETLSFSFNENKVGHLLGLDINSIRNHKYFDCFASSSFEVCKLVTDNKKTITRDLLSKKAPNNILDLSKIIDKSLGFYEMYDIVLNNIHTIIKFDIKKVPLNGNDSKCDVDYLIGFSARNQKKVYFGLKKEENYNSYYIKTFLIDIDYEKFLQNQSLVLPISMVHRDNDWNSTEEFMPLVNRLEMLKKYLTIARKQNMNVDVTSEFMEMLTLKIDYDDIKNKNDQLVLENESLKQTQSKVKVFINKYFK
jgi:hypothetical protein